MSNAEDIQFEFNLGQAGTKSFSTIQEAKEWFINEKDQWKWLYPNNARPEPILGDINQRIDRVLNVVMGKLREAANTSDAVQQKTFIKQVNNHLEANLQKGFIFSNTPEMEYINQLRQENEILAAYTAAPFFGISKHVPPEVFEGMFNCLSFKHGLIDRSESERDALNTLRLEWNDLLNDGKKEFLEASKNRKSFEDEYRSLLNQQKEDFEEFAGQSKESFDKLVNESEGKLEDIERTYDQKLALQSSVQYWEEKKTTHDTISQKYWKIAILVFIFVGFALGIETWLVIGPTNTIAEIQIWKFGMLLLTAAIGIWIIRILVRILLSNIHLGSDANERRTMLLTYLSLLRSGEGPTEKQRELILQILFRPVSTGIVKDDALPPTVSQWLNLITSDRQ